MPAKILVPRAELDAVIATCVVQIGDQAHVDLGGLIDALHHSADRVLNGGDFAPIPAAPPPPRPPDDSPAWLIGQQHQPVEPPAPRSPRFGKVVAEIDQPWSPDAVAALDKEMNALEENRARAEERARQDEAQRRLDAGLGGPGGPVAGMPLGNPDAEPRRYAHDGLIGDQDLDGATE